MDGMRKGGARRAIGANPAGELAQYARHVADPRPAQRAAALPPKQPLRAGHAQAAVAALQQDGVPWAVPADDAELRLLVLD